MNKKEYNAPEMEVVKIQTIGMMASSPENIMNVNGTPVTDGEVYAE